MQDCLHGITGAARKIAIFGLSANPPTYQQGHYGMIQTLVAQNLYSHILILPVYEHIFSKKLVSFHHRLAMCELCFGDMSTPSCEVRVVELERVVSEKMSQTNPSQRVGTIDIVDELISVLGTEPELHLVLGKDTYRDLSAGRWKQSERLMDLVHLDVFERQGVDVDGLVRTPSGRLAEYRNICDNGDFKDVCSTNVREYFRNGQVEEAQQLLRPNVFDYIMEHHLYLERADGSGVGVGVGVDTGSGNSSNITDTISLPADTKNDKKGTGDEL